MIRTLIFKLFQPARTWPGAHIHQFEKLQALDSEYLALVVGLQVSAYGSPTQSDEGDIWVLEWDTAFKQWVRDQRIRFKHKVTGAYLASHDRKFGRPISGQQEVCAKAKSGDTTWAATEGVYFPERSEL